MGWSDTMLYLFSILFFSYGLKRHHVVLCFLFYFSAMCWSDTMLYCVFYFIFQLWVEATPCCIVFSILFFSYVLKWHHVVFVFYFIFQLWVEVTPCCICFLFYISAMGWSETMLYSVFVGHLMSTVTKVSLKFNSSCLFGDVFKWIKRAKR
jgi:hypothetical protein